MGSKGWIKRVLPFFATFAVGIFIAGLFGFGGPRFGRHGRWERRMEFERLRTENEELRNENLRLRNEACAQTDNAFQIEDVPPVLDPPRPPRAILVPHHPPRR